MIQTLNNIVGKEAVYIGIESLNEYQTRQRETNVK